MELELELKITKSQNVFLEFKVVQAPEGVGLNANLKRRFVQFQVPTPVFAHFTVAMLVDKMKRSGFPPLGEGCVVIDGNRVPLASTSKLEAAGLASVIGKTIFYQLFWKLQSKEEIESEKQWQAEKQQTTIKFLPTKESRGSQSAGSRGSSRGGPKLVLPEVVTPQKETKEVPLLVIQAEPVETKVEVPVIVEPKPEESSGVSLVIETVPAAAPAKATGLGAKPIVTVSGADSKQLRRVSQKMAQKPRTSISRGSPAGAAVAEEPAEPEKSLPVIDFGVVEAKKANRQSGFRKTADVEKEQQDAKERAELVRQEHEEKVRLEKLAILGPSVMGSVFSTVKNEPSTKVWKVVDSELALVDQKAWGKFLVTTAYVVLHIGDNGTCHIYYWIGKDASLDSSATAALKVSELDEHLGGETVQHREVQAHESATFLAVFKNCAMSYIGDAGKELEGTTAIPSNFETVLLHLKGRRTVRVTPVPVSYESLNSGDSFVLDTGSMIFTWNGSSACRAEKATAVQTVLNLKNSRTPTPLVQVIEQGQENAPFWKALGGKGPIKKADEVEDDDAFERRKERVVKLYQISDASGEVEVKLVANPPLQQMFLVSSDAHILDIENEIFVWIGKGCTQQEKDSAMTHAIKFLETSGRPSWVPITRMLEHAETPIFKSQFIHWTNPAGTAKPAASASGAPTDDKFGLHKLISNTGDEKQVDARYDGDAEKFALDAKGSILIWRIENFKKVFLPKKEYGVFYSGDSYIILFTPDHGEAAFPTVYYWLGTQSTQDERGAAAHFTREVAKGEASHCRVVQGKEPPHFLHLFKGNFVIRDGGVASGFSQLNEVDKFASSEPELFHIRGSNERDTRAVQVPCACGSLNSSDCFVLTYENEKKQYIWFGKGATFVEREFSKKAATFLASQATFPANEWILAEMDEGNEFDDFWDLLGGKGEYLNPPELQDDVREPRLFHCSNASGFFEVEEIINFCQEDLMMDDVYLLDTYSTVFVWVGPEANEAEKKFSFEMALEYVQTCSQYDGRSLDTPVACTVAGFEPPMFTSWFQSWNKQTAGKDQYQLFLAELGAEGAATVEIDVKKALSVIKVAESGVISQFYPYAELNRYDNASKPLPPRVDPKRLEEYLADDEFESLFKMTKDKWLNDKSIPDWKKRKLKSQLKLW